MQFYSPKLKVVVAEMATKTQLLIRLLTQF